MLIAGMAHFLSQVGRWFTTGAHWRGTDGIPHRIVEHLSMSGAATLAAIVIALPIALWLGHTGRGGFAAINVSNIGRAVPSFAILVLGAQIFGIGAKPAFIALVALAVPPIVTNTYTGVRQVDEDLRDAAKGMGMTGGQVLRRVELPVAIPLIFAGIRTAGVQVVATATLAAVIAWGGLGRYIIDGIAQQDHVKVFSGALIVVVLSFLTEVGLAGLQRAVTPAGLRKPGLRPGAGRGVEVTDEAA
jgi:osmoprotectant transport system permease protein